MLNDSRDEISVEVDNGTDKVVPHDTLSDGFPVEVRLPEQRQDRLQGQLYHWGRRWEGPNLHQMLFLDGLDSCHILCQYCKVIFKTIFFKNIHLTFSGVYRKESKPISPYLLLFKH